MSDEPKPKKKKNRAISLLLKLLRYGIAILGIWWIVNQLQWRDHVNLVTKPDLSVVSVPVVGEADPNRSFYNIIDPDTGAERRAFDDELVSRADRKTVDVMRDGKRVEFEMLGMQLEIDPTTHSSASRKAKQLLVRESSTAPAQWIKPDEVAGKFTVKTPRPALEVGLKSMLRDANPWLLVAALAIFPLTCILTTFRWLELLKPLGVRLPFFRAFALNMVGNFYSTFLPGSSSGDFIKAYLAAKTTPHKTNVVLSVFIDRVIGLITLVGLGGVLSAYQYFTATDRNSPTARACMQVALGAAFIYVCMLMA
ncbi:MAG TPA: lysylphosphatidylglycerol synthase transmembrane domain-containing protein, partial [Tepidisphaeraceae bacterium]|nr:lysylphosphatidylglycerol synthase transmembrane domain-containing protein [Tepidisphaeraceae bacterium]